MRTTVVSLRFQLLRLLALALAALLLFTACKSKAERVQEQLDLGQRYLTELNYTEAIIAFTEAIEIDPESIPAYMGRAKAYSGTEQYEEAKTDYTTVIDKTAEQPYTQAEAYLGRGEVNELTADDRAALADYQTAADVLEAADPEKITDVTQQMVEALKIRIYNAYARLSAFFGQHEAAVTAYTGALNSLALLPDDADVLDVPEAKVTSYSGRAASNLELEAYEAVLPDYDALIELGEDKISERDILLAALSLAHSQAEDLGASDAWLEEVDHLDYAESIEMNTMLDILSQTAVLAAENGEDAYEDIQELVTSEEAAQAMRNLLTRGYQLRFYNDNGRCWRSMLAKLPGPMSITRRMVWLLPRSWLSLQLPPPRKIWRLFPLTPSISTTVGARAVVAKVRESGTSSILVAATMRSAAMIGRMTNRWAALHNNRSGRLRQRRLHQLRQLLPNGLPFKQAILMKVKVV